MAWFDLARQRFSWQVMFAGMHIKTNKKRLSHIWLKCNMNICKYQLLVDYHGGLALIGLSEQTNLVYCLQWLTCTCST